MGRWHDEMISLSFRHILLSVIYSAKVSPLWATFGFISSYFVLGRVFFPNMWGWTPSLLLESIVSMQLRFLPACMDRGVVLSGVCLDLRLKHNSIEYNGIQLLSGPLKVFCSVCHLVDSSVVEPHTTFLVDSALCLDNI
jgi:hypothetical protein